MYEEIFDIIDREADNGDSLEVRERERKRSIGRFDHLVDCIYRASFSVIPLPVVQVQVWAVIFWKKSMIGKEIDQIVHLQSISIDFQRN